MTKKLECSNENSGESMVCLRDLSGLWRRSLIAWPDGRSDSTTEVFWLQGPRHYADLRVPAGRPRFSGIKSLRDLDWTMLRFMARQEGFFGRFDIVDSVGYWHRAFDYQPDSGVADRGRLAFENGILIERGVDLPYVEHWARPLACDSAMALSLATDAGTLGCLVMAGDAFIYARDRATPLPRGATLNQMIDGAASLKTAQELFDCEISFGRRHGDDWRIECSSHRYREGRALSPALDCVNQLLVIDDVTPEGTPIKRGWRITAYESSRNVPLSFWFGSNGAENAPGPSGWAHHMDTAAFGETR